MENVQIVKNLFRELFFESWMSETDWAEVEADLLRQSNTSYEEMAKDIETGVQNGYSVDYQVKLMKDLFKSRP